MGGGRRGKKKTSKASSTERKYARPRAAPSCRARLRSVAGRRKVRPLRSVVWVVAIGWLAATCVCTVSMSVRIRQSRRNGAMGASAGEIRALPATQATEVVRKVVRKVVSKVVRRPHQESHQDVYEFADHLADEAA